jgi:uncharacterized protein (TIGR02757 family)
LIPHAELKIFFDEKYRQYASPRFIESDPIQIPHRYHRNEDIEIAGFLAASLAWGQRPMIIRFVGSLLDRMGESPYEFLMDSSEVEFNSFSDFYYRTFNGCDCVAFLESLRRIYRHEGGLGSVFEEGYAKGNSIQYSIGHFRSVFIGDDFPTRSTKHISDSMSGSAAKRLNMYLRWMVRNSSEGIDFGLWAKIPTSALMLPLDVHTARVARSLGLLTRKQNDWKAVEEVTQNLRIFDPNDPVKYDFALFGLGVFEKFS